MSNPNTRQKRPPAEGERSARRGYVHQDRFSGRLIHTALLDDSLRWVGLADRGAGTFDDLVLGLRDEVVAHQFKQSAAPIPIGLISLLLGTNAGIADLAASFAMLRRQFPESRIRLRYLDNRPAAANDQLISGNALSSTRVFLDDFRRNHHRSLSEWLASHWNQLISELQQTSGMLAADFEDLWTSLEIVLGDDAELASLSSDDPAKVDEIDQLSERLAGLIDDHPERDRWDVGELLAALGWWVGSGRVHTFPIQPHVQSNSVTEERMAQALADHPSGYLSLVGSPGSGKSTFLQREVRPTGRRHVIRYLAFVPGHAQGQGRGESESFFDDVCRQLADAGLPRKRMRDATLMLRQQEFEHLLGEAGRSFTNDGTEFVIVIDGLDHVPREERPTQSFLFMLPLPQAVPRGVRIILGTQRLSGLGLPPQVQAEAEMEGRNIIIAPLSLTAVMAMANAMGLAPEVDRRRLFQITGGHPLVSHYIIGRLAGSASAEWDSILSEDVAPGGDLDAIYEAAWRSSGDDAMSGVVHRVLALLGWIEGDIEPGLLARIVGEQAVETTFERTRHLLLVRNQRWSLFHNSFRLFLRRKRISKFGQPDPNYTEQAIYSRLANLVGKAADDSPQRWLAFRYTYLSGNHERARSIASRCYFVSQYVAGRSASATRGDIRDAYGLYSQLESGAVGLFDLMLADDEIYRRAEVLAGAETRVDALIALGDLDAAEAALEDVQPADKKWLVIDALLKAGYVDRARALFDEIDIALGFDEPSSTFRYGADQRLSEWAMRAVIFLDEGQLRRRAEQSATTELDSDREHQDRPDGFEQRLKWEIARALVAIGRDVDTIAARWQVEDVNMPILMIEAAAIVDATTNNIRITALLNRIEAHPSFDAVGTSWRLLAARISLDIGLDDLARRFAASVPVIGLASIDPPGHFDRAGPTALDLANAVALHARLRQTIPPLTPSKERLLRATESQIVWLSEAIGLARAGCPLPKSEVERRLNKSVVFVTLGYVDNDDDWAVRHDASALLGIVIGLLFSLLDLSPGLVFDPASVSEALLAGGTRCFGARIDIRRQLAFSQFQRDHNQTRARARLESALAETNESDPRTQLEEQVQFATVFAQIADQDKARAILSSLREEALGVWLAAKKDGQYQLWAAMLTRANAADPEGRVGRVVIALRLLDGLLQTEGDDMGGRIARHVMFEAASVGPDMTWQVACWGANAHRVSWDGIVDAAMRGVVVRNPALAEVALVTWLHLALPWYDEPHGSIVTQGQFLADVVAVADADSLTTIEQRAVDGIDRLARPATKLKLLRRLRSALLARRHPAGRALTSLNSWFKLDGSGRDSDEPDYVEVDTLSDAEKALRKEDQQQTGSRHVSSSVPSWNLRRRLQELAVEAPWLEARNFFQRNSLLLNDELLVLAFARAATSAGDLEFARVTLKPLLESEAEGWGGFYGRGRLTYYRARRVLGDADVFEAARQEFVHELTTSPYGTSLALWSIDDMFPLLYNRTNWPELWDRLASQIVATREWRIGQPLKMQSKVSNDVDLIAEMVAWGLSLSASSMEDCAAEAALALAEYQDGEIFCAIVDRLLAGELEQPRLGADLLRQRWFKTSVRSAYAQRLQTLADHDDIAVAATACWLGQKWGMAIRPTGSSLPGFYKLHLPPNSDWPSTNERRTSEIIGDPLSLSSHWFDLIKFVASAADISTQHVRQRVEQVVFASGVREGAGNQDMKLEDTLGRLALKVSYHRPQAMSVFRAFRIIVGELWRAGQIAPNRLRPTLKTLRVHPEVVPLPSVRPRPFELILPNVSYLVSGSDEARWREAVTDDVAARTPDCGIFAEWYRSVKRDRQRSATAELLMLRSALDPGAELKDGLEQLPEVVWIGYLLPTYEDVEVHPSRCAVIRLRRLFLATEPVLILCPLVAKQLGWSPDLDEIGLYRDTSGEPMVSTLRWSEGVEQSVGSEERRASGQRVIFTPKGSRLFQDKFGITKTHWLAWRRVESRERDNGIKRAFAWSHS